MSEFERFLPGCAVIATGIALTAWIFLSPDAALANGQKNTSIQPEVSLPADPGEIVKQGDTPSAVAPPPCACPGGEQKAAKPKFAGLAGGAAGPLDESDEVAALASVQLALNSVGDGQAYVWQRTNGRLSGFVRPVSSFRNADGQICRHVIVLLTTGRETKKTESTACRIEGGRWQLGG